MTKKIRTQAIRVLDAQKIAYTVHLFPESIHDAEEVAKEIGLPAEQVFKTLVVLREDQAERHPHLVMIPGNQELDLRQFAHEIGTKSVRMATHTQAEQLTGLKVGGISALALLQRAFSIYIDASATNYTEIAISAGQRGVDIQLAVTDLLHITGAQTVNATRPKH